MVEADELSVTSDEAAPSRSSPTVSPPTTDPKPGEGWGLPLIVVIIGMFMSVLDTSIVNVAVPTIQREYNVTTDEIQWITTAYMLCLGVVVPTSAWLGDRLGLRRMYLLSLVSFGVFSALCGMADNLGSMVLFRILQAVPGGMIPVTCLTILYRMVPPHKLGAAMGLYGLGIVVAPGVGPTLGGYLVEYVNWRLIFYINVPIGVIGAVAAIAVLPHFPGRAGRRFDLLGFVCIAGGMFALLLALSEGQTWGWTSYPILILVAAAVNLLLLFVAIELRSGDPLLDVRVFAHWPFINSLLLIAILSIGLFAVLFYVPLFLQEGQNLTPWHTGLVLLPQALMMMATMPTAGRIYDRIGPRWPAVIGLTLCGVGTLLLAHINIDLTRPELITCMVIRAAGIGLAMMPIMTGGLSALPANIVSSGSAFNTLTQRVTASFGLAALTALATAQQAQFMSNRASLLSTGANTDPRIVAMQHQGPGGLIGLWQQTQIEVEAESYSNVFLIAGVCTLGGVLLALRLRSGKPGRGEDSEPVEAG
ncbi:MAG: DHA2 family efflux MFS transporter permease subunit [Pseudonocardia sp.]|nr:DHA2 family efflux MFS transporter permease subunit [Pseudonocardia sp.]